MVRCAHCGEAFESTKSTQRYCSPSCRHRAHGRSWRAAHQPTAPLREVRCANCRVPFQTKSSVKIFCSRGCARRVNKLKYTARRMVELAGSGKLEPARSRGYRGRYTPAEIDALRADPLCVLPNRGLCGQWRKCKALGIPRHPSLRVYPPLSPTAAARKEASRTPEYRRAKGRRAYFRRKVRGSPEPILAELRQLARGHMLAEDVIVEGFATVLRLAIPAAEAFKLARTEVNRTSAQPFKEQPFNPAIDYAARETGRQVARACDIRAARGEV